MDENIYGSRNRRYGVIYGSINSRKGRQILYGIKGVKDLGIQGLRGVKGSSGNLSNLRNLEEFRGSFNGDFRRF